MNGIIVGRAIENSQKIYRIILFSYQNKEWKFTKQQVLEHQLKDSIVKGKVEIINAKVENGTLKGSTGELGRFENKVNKPMVILSELIAEGQGVIGYKVANYEGVVKNLPLKEILAYCARVTNNNGIPIQNGMFVTEKGGQRAHIRSYPGGEYIQEVIERKKSSNAKPAEVDTKVNAKAINKLEELFTPEQINELKIGKQHGVNIKIYGNNKLSAEQMRVIRKGLEEGINAKLFADPAFSVDAMRILRADMKYGVNVGYYLNPKYSAEQLSELSTGFISGVDVSKYADPKLTPEEMAEIRLRLENNIFKEHSVNKDESWK